MKVLVTGASGFIGSHVCEKLRDRGHDVTAMASYRSQDTYGWIDDVRIYDNDIRIVRGDVRDIERMRHLIKGHDYVCHLAALISVPDSYDRPRSYMETNALGTMNVLLAARDHDVKVIHTSTSEVYGTAQYVPMDEKHPTVPQSPYAASKGAADALVESFNRSYGMETITLRPFNAYGPRQSTRAVTARIIAQAAHTGKVELGNPLAIRDFTYVSDIARAYELAISEEVRPAVYNITAECPVTISFWAERIFNLAQPELETNIIYSNERLRPSRSEVDRLEGSSDNFGREANWVARTTINDGLRDTINWALGRRYISRGDFI
jgi:nucleoside-diphosphate-sugar epimerase